MSEVETLASLKKQILTRQHEDETKSVGRLITSDTLSSDQRQSILVDARKMVVRSRENEEAQGTLDAFLQEFGLSNQEGIALMCLAESLLRIPDTETADKLIAEKIGSGNWESHLGHSGSLFVNASTWGLMLTGKLVVPNELLGDTHWYSRIVGRLGDTIVRNAILQAMKILGNQFIIGHTIDDALKRARQLQEAGNGENIYFSFDMLGEGARSLSQASDYFESYQNALHILGRHSGSTDIRKNNGISVKLSALHPRYHPFQRERVLNELYPKVLELCVLAKQYNIGLSIDAEEAYRLELSLEIFENLLKESVLQGWEGLGFVLQAYQKRAVPVAKWLVAVSREYCRKIMVRLVKGAYWDSEIKYAQEVGVEDYPVFTRKANTDFSYQICAQILLSEQAYIFPQFATHNAYSVALIKEIAKGKKFEFQRLQGMGNLLFDNIEGDKFHGVNIRIYAPVGAHKDLLPYLMRRLLENGANSSFVNRFLDRETPVETLVSDVRSNVEKVENFRHAKIEKPISIFKKSHTPRKNSKGIDLTQRMISKELALRLEQFKFNVYSYKLNVENLKEANKYKIYSPITGLSLAEIPLSNQADVVSSIDQAFQSQSRWNARGADGRAALLDNIAEQFEENTEKLVAFIVYEAGRTLQDALSEIREAVDFCRYYSRLAKQTFEPEELVGPTGEKNTLGIEGRGVFVCISPWNFPLAIFTGQIVAALVAGNTVVAKPAEQTPLTASYASDLMYNAGIPREVLHVVFGGASVGRLLVESERVAGVAFTGSTATAQKISECLCLRNAAISPLIAETGGINAMVVDSSALLEQVTDDVIQSAFSSAGQRCSALRILYIQEEIADELIEMLSGACEELIVGDPSQISTDIGPAIDDAALDKLQRYIGSIKQTTRTVFEYPANRLPPSGCFIGPHIFELNSGKELGEEIFGPVLHVVRFDKDQLDDVIDTVNGTGYGLTFGIHSRIQSNVEYLVERIRVGNIYVNRNMVGAVVGVNPFGGCGLSGTGPKAGGPHYLSRFSTEKTMTSNLAAVGGNTVLMTLDEG